MDHVIERVLLSLFQDGQRRLDALKAQFPGHESAVDAAYMAGSEFFANRAADLDLVASEITPDQFKEVERQWMQQQQLRLN